MIHFMFVYKKEKEKKEVVTSKLDHLRRRRRRIFPPRVSPTFSPRSRIIDEIVCGPNYLLLNSYLRRERWGRHTGYLYKFTSQLLKRNAKKHPFIPPSCPPFH